MASRRNEHQEDARLRVMQMIEKCPQMTSRQVAQVVGISNGSAYYLLTSLIEKGLIKFANFNKESKKVKYTYLLTPKGIREKSLLTQKFLHRKKNEYKALKDEIIQLERSAGIRLDE
jgi:EPS-associated MarR family transcriptional regulator